MSILQKKALFLLDFRTQVKARANAREITNNAALLLSVFACDTEF
jgi:hypothetical protein